MKCRWNKLLEETGWIADCKLVFNAERTLCSDMESLAVVFWIWILSLPAGTPLLVTKNFQECDHFHHVTKFVSKFVQRDIIVRDARCFHHIKNGVCACAGNW